jgi:hypothetical protein
MFETDSVLSSALSEFMDVEITTLLPAYLRIHSFPICPWSRYTEILSRLTVSVPNARECQLRFISYVTGRVP